ncbi:Receptor-like protein 9b [Frankliniella fusca]|uniref:Receptor-like protein 9b n=1 Tax=Frankliniella fusca TaxID=407009 RepID=A0AAE1HXQ0_9NEOP|nr:Receptor-like protein 9b [Frankliniella fusca]
MFYNYPNVSCRETFTHSHGSTPQETLKSLLLIPMTEINIKDAHLLLLSTKTSYKPDRSSQVDLTNIQHHNNCRKIFLAELH